MLGVPFTSVLRIEAIGFPSFGRLLHMAFPAGFPTASKGDVQGFMGLGLRVSGIRVYVYKDLWVQGLGFTGLGIACGSAWSGSAQFFPGSHISNMASLPRKIIIGHTQRLQNPSIKEYTLNYTRNPNLV